MKLRKIKWNNHPILGNLELNFVNPLSNTPYDTIVIAGENGTGKTFVTVGGRFFPKAPDCG